MKKLSKKAWCGIALLLLVVIGCLWYARPVTILEIQPELDPEIIDITIIRNGGVDDFQSRALRLDLSNATSRETYETIANWKFRRPPTNLLRIAFPPLANVYVNPSVHTINDYEYQFYITIYHPQTVEQQMELDCDFDSWCYHDFARHGNISLPLWAPSGLDYKAWGDQLWEMAAEQ